MTGERKIWLAAFGVSLFFHVCFFVCAGHFTYEKTERPIVVRLIEHTQTATSLPHSQNNNIPEPSHTAHKTASKRNLLKKTAPTQTTPEKSSENIENESLQSVATDNSDETTQGTGKGESGDGNSKGTADVGSGKQQGAIVDVTALVITKKVTPMYPAFSRKRREEGTVQLLITILKNSVSECKIEKSSGYGRLDEAARAAVMQWKFAEVSQAKVRVPVSFRIKD